MTHKITYLGQSFVAQEGETVLQCLLRHGILMNYSCESGICKTCLKKCRQGQVSAESQAGLTQNQLKLNCFLPCSCVVTSDLNISDLNAEDDVRVELIHKTFLGPGILKIRLKVQDEFIIYPGQYINLITPVGIRSYSAANLPHESNEIELHVKHHSQGLVSSWLVNSAQIGIKMTIRGGLGESFYNAEEGTSYPMILTARGTGMAPIYAILQGALKNNHAGNILLVLPQKHYFSNEIKAIKASFPHFQLIETDSFDSVSLNHYISPETKFYCAGAPDFVKSTKRHAFLSGVQHGRLYSDSFLTKKNQ